jgi:hypothetical protein
MRIQRIATKQGHPVPKNAGYAQGPFPPELFQTPEVITDYLPFDQDLPEGATAQNNFTEPRKFRCKYCGVTVLMNQMGDHICEGLEDGEDA